MPTTHNPPEHVVRRRRLIIDAALDLHRQSAPITVASILEKARSLDLAGQTA